MIEITHTEEAVLRRADLLHAGLRPKQITAAVRAGSLLRLRRDRYMVAAQEGIDRAVRIGGRVGCVSALASLGAFVFDRTKLHVHFDRSMSRLRSPDDRSRPFLAKDRDTVVLHWWPLTEPCSRGLVSVADAVAQAVRCQDARSAVATIDSVLHLGIIAMDDLRDVFASLPARYRVILTLADASAEAGSETFMRLILRQAGLSYRTQVSIPAVGRVDFLVEGWLIIECDSKAHHEGWDKQRSDRRRDLAAAALGFTTIRPLAEDLFFHRDVVVAAVRGLVAARRRA